MSTSTRPDPAEHWHRILVAVDDTAGALHAARVAVDLAVTVAAQVRFLHVLHDGELTRTLAGQHRNGTLRERRITAGASLLRHVGATAGEAGLTAETVVVEGHPAAVILAEAAAWRADVVVLGTSRRRTAGSPYIGDTARHVLEFSDVPVLTVPWGPGDHGRGPRSQAKAK